MPRKRILLVDDDPDLVETVEFFLTANDYDVIVATNGKDGLEQAEARKMDLVLLDVTMPGMDGLEVCKRLKANAMTTSIPIIMVTAEGKGDDVAHALSAGAKDYVVKPFNLEDLVERIEVVLGDRGPAKE